MKDGWMGRGGEKGKGQVRNRGEKGNDRDSGTGWLGELGTYGCMP